MVKYILFYLIVVSHSIIRGVTIQCVSESKNWSKKAHATVGKNTLFPWELNFSRFANNYSSVKPNNFVYAKSPK